MVFNHLLSNFSYDKQNQIRRVNALSKYFFMLRRKKM